MGRSKRVSRSKSQGNLDEKDAPLSPLSGLAGNGLKSSAVFQRKQYRNGDIHEGFNSQRGLRTAWGIYLWRNGDKYTGNWCENLMSGLGTFHWAVGDIYQGEVRSY